MLRVAISLETILGSVGTWNFVKEKVKIRKGEGIWKTPDNEKGNNREWAQLELLQSTDIFPLILDLSTCLLIQICVC